MSLPLQPLQAPLSNEGWTLQQEISGLTTCVEGAVTGPRANQARPRANQPRLGRALWKGRPMPVKSQNPWGEGSLTTSWPRAKSFCRSNNVGATPHTI